MNWTAKISKSGVTWLILNDTACVCCTPDPTRKGYMWQFRKIYSFASTIEEAMNYVEAGQEFFEVMRRNPYSQG